MAEPMVMDGSDLFLGLDPGLSGALALVDGDGRFVDALTLSVGSGKKRAPRPPLEILEWGLGHAPQIRFALLERVSAMPKQGIASTFKFGRSYGSLEMLLPVLRVPWERITPSKWQGAMNCRTQGVKAVSRAAAQELFPTTRITNATADAALLAELARRTWAERHP